MESIYGDVCEHQAQTVQSRSRPIHDHDHAIKNVPSLLEKIKSCAKQLLECLESEVQQVKHKNCLQKQQVPPF